jgi:hypothetical protein
MKFILYSLLVVEIVAAIAATAATIFAVAANDPVIDIAAACAVALFFLVNVTIGQITKQASQGRTDK